MKRFSMAAVSAAVSVSLLAGCAGQSDSGKTDAPSKAPSTEAPAKKAEPAVFTISMGTEGNTYVEASADINKEKWVTELEKKTNVDMKINLLPHKDFVQKLSLMFASNDLTDVVAGSDALNNVMGGSVQNGFFMPLDELLKEHGQNLLKKVPKEAWERASYNGKIYGIPEWLSVPSRRATFIREDLLAKTGLPVPKTPEDMLNVLRAFKKLGVEQPYAFRENFKYADTFFGAYDVLPYSDMWEKQGDQIVPKFFDSENMMKALQMYKTMYDEGLIAKDFATITGSMQSKTIASGKSGVWVKNASSLSSTERDLKAVLPDGKVALIASPKGPEGKGGYMLYGNTLRVFYINKNVKKETAAAIIKMYDFMASPEGEKFFVTSDTGTYKPPETAEAEKEEGFRMNWLWMAKDATYNETQLKATDIGRRELDGFKNVLSKEGLRGITFAPALKSTAKFTELSPGFDQPPKLLVEHMYKMIFGMEPISNWPKVIEEWKSKGGNEIIKEATERFNKKEGVYIGPNSNVK